MEEKNWKWKEWHLLAEEDINGKFIIHNNIYWFKKGKLHRLDGPAKELSGEKFWYKEGVLHRLDGPAYESIDGSKSWYKEGKLHNLYGPAIEDYSLRNPKKLYIEGERYTEEKWKKLSFIILNDLEVFL